MNHMISTLVLMLLGALVLFAVVAPDALWTSVKQVDQVTVQQTTEQRIP